LVAERIRRRRRSRETPDARNFRRLLRRSESVSRQKSEL
jgi:hypothetical protein